MRHFSSKQYFVLAGLFGVMMVYLCSRGSLWGNFCSNILLIDTLSDFQTGETGFFEKIYHPKTDRISYERLTWLRGYILWREGKQEEAELEWQLSPQYVSQMLVAKITLNDWKQSEIEDISRIALLLDPYSDSVTKEVTLSLLNNGQWPSNYDIFMEASSKNPHNPIIKAALALTMLNYNPTENDPLLLFDEAMHEAPNNTTVLLYGFRIMDKSRNFDADRMRRLAELAAVQSPQFHDLGFTFGIATAFQRLGDYESAAKYNLETLKIDPFHPAANLQQAELLQILGEYNNQQPWLDRAVKYRIANVSYYQRLIAILAKDQKITLAQKIFCEGVSLQMPPIVLTDTLTDELKKEFIELNCQSVN